VARFPCTCDQVAPVARLLRRALRQPHRLHEHPWLSLSAACSGATRRHRCAALPLRHTGASGRRAAVPGPDQCQDRYHVPRLRSFRAPQAQGSQPLSALVPLRLAVPADQRSLGPDPTRARLRPGANPGASRRRRLCAERVPRAATGSARQCACEADLRRAFGGKEGARLYAACPGASATSVAGGFGDSRHRRRGRIGRRFKM